MDEPQENAGKGHVIRGSPFLRTGFSFLSRKGISGGNPPTPQSFHKAKVKPICNSFGHFVMNNPPTKISNSNPYSGVELNS